MLARNIWGRAIGSTGVEEALGDGWFGVAIGPEKDLLCSLDYSWLTVYVEPPGSSFLTFENSRC